MKKILVFNPRKDIAEGIALVLEAEFNCKAIWVYHRDEALKIITQFQPDLIVGCLHEAVGGELEWLRKIKEQYAEEQMPIILIGNAGQLNLGPDDARTLHTLVDYQLDCPFKPESLLNSVESILYKAC